jgi:hypothetical protein
MISFLYDEATARNLGMTRLTLVLMVWTPLDGQRTCFRFHAWSAGISVKFGTFVRTQMLEKRVDLGATMLCENEGRSQSELYQR